ncbi:Egt2p LALA0_S13e02080g [Lachancea lanzarotensis]|uniref:LALA0S13e02080g1_1 n=1 Tax=Lachancea lanzarotensis TaxID=1245769 RepID=A0A0C7NA56_9SACH|nr:uncharacterized protein LALA0_S13e02080g [Lachancea lanzarotensis]CEP64746.1 LALA0S13e02080g1_1 [Lachancea lanzarotensis]
MVPLVKTFLSTLCLVGIVSARYSNGTTPSSATVPQPSPTAFFSSVHLVDSYTGSNISNDKEHWFLIEAEIYVSAGFDGELYLNAPQSLEGFANGSFDLVQNVTSVGSVTRNASNVFTIRPDVSDTDRSSTFNVLAHLSAGTKSIIDSPQTVDFEFELSPGSKLIQPIDFIAQDLSKSQTNARVGTDNSITYTLDVPFSEYPGELNFAASFSGKDAFTFDTSLTSVQVVTAVDAFNQPTKAINLTAVEDNSDASAINLSLESQISGGIFIRISYTTTPIENVASVETVATLNYPSLSTYKRDISITFEDLVVLEATSNLDNFGEQVFVVTGSGSFPTVTATNFSSSATAASASAVNATVGTVVSNSANMSSLLVTITPTANFTSATSGTPFETHNSTINTGASLTSISGVASITSPPIQQSSVNASNTTVVTSNSNGVVLTYSVVTRTSDGQYDVFTSFFPIATLPSQSQANSTGVNSDSLYIVNATSPSTKVYPTQTVFNRTVSGEVSVFTSLIPVATVGASKSSTACALSSSSSSHDVLVLASITGSSSSKSTAGVKTQSRKKASSSSTESGASQTTEFQTRAYLTYSVVTTTSDGKVFEYTSWFPTSTLSPEVPVKSQSVSAAGAPALSTTESKNLVATTLTQIKGGQISLITTMVPVETQTIKSSELSASQSAASRKPAQSYYSTVVNTTILKTTGSVTQSLTTSYGVSAELLASAQSEIVSTSESLIGAATLSSGTAKTQSTAPSRIDNSFNTASSVLAVTNTGVSTRVSQATQGELLTTYENPIGASTLATAATGAQQDTSVSKSMGALVQTQSSLEPTASRSTLSGSYTIEYQSQTSQASSTRVLSTFDGAGAQLRASIFGSIISILALLL